VPDAPDDDAPGAAVPGLPDLDGLDQLGGGALGGLLEQAQQMMAAQAEAASREVEGVSGGGAVRIRATGTGDILSVAIAGEVVDPSDVSMLEDLVLAALHDMNERLREIQREALGPYGDLFGGT
jgi:DNA-binding YbaB/EbfC family protein